MNDYPSDFKIHILYDFVDGPWGGANQFLKALRKEWRRRDLYVERCADADVVLFESFDSLLDVLDKKRENPETVFVHRIDGPTSMVRGYGRSANRRVFHANELVADGTVFQSEWSKHQNFRLGLAPTPYTTKVLNAPDPDLFNRIGVSSELDEPVKLIGTSWSGNFRKGFDVYDYLDDALDHDRFEFTFVGNSPIEFENINHVDPVPPEDIAGFLKQHDVFITASRNDPCSNSLIEALHCGLPAVARDDGGHPEIVENGGGVFSGRGDVVECIEEVVENYEECQRNIELPDIEESGRQYARFALNIHEAVKSEEYTPKTLDEREAYLGKLRQRVMTHRNRAENLAGRARDWIRFRLSSEYGT